MTWKQRWVFAQWDPCVSRQVWTSYRINDPLQCFKAIIHWEDMVLAISNHCQLRKKKKVSYSSTQPPASFPNDVWDTVWDQVKSEHNEARCVNTPVSHWSPSPPRSILRHPDSAIGWPVRYSQRSKNRKDCRHLESHYINQNTYTDNTPDSYSHRKKMCYLEPKRVIRLSL